MTKLKLLVETLDSNEQPFTPCCPNGIFLAASCDCGYDELLAGLEEKPCT